MDWPHALDPELGSSTVRVHMQHAPDWLCSLCVLALALHETDWFFVQHALCGIGTWHAGPLRDPQATPWA